ncbi:hypothetical protein [Synechocystis sp. PCC 7338]|uniref:hypothetical protein n=1 Tax=Synechocystis sp. PCC 7338 TaxID=2732530 RepID=UPI001BB0BDAA|nr:hypothetical protein [Synechocystis sp. PCC 7338]QUS60022.1 hypothetical protein HTZ78_04600 [Synechocystis sp. PCC 7338]
MDENLKISAFKDISAFLLTTLQSQTKINLDIKYVKNADEAHRDLKQNLAHIILMSYTEAIFAQDTGMIMPSERHWLEKFHGC